MKRIWKAAAWFWEYVVIRVSPIVAVAIVLSVAFCNCSTVNEAWDRGIAEAGANPDAPARVEAGKRWVVGLVLFDAVGLGIFLPAKEVAELALVTEPGNAK